jgi:hypothetical protein
MSFLDMGPKTSAEARKATYRSLLSSLLLFAMAFGFFVLERLNVISFDDQSRPAFAMAFAMAVAGAILAIALGHRATYQRLKDEGR